MLKSSRTHPVSINEMPIDEAKNLGAMALFGENTAISSVSFPLVNSARNYAVVRTYQYRRIRILQNYRRSVSGSGVRRIEAVTGWAAYEMMQEDRKLINSAADALKSNSAGILERIEKLQAELERR